ncbi:MAG: 3-phosphoshikimate 1-carboxyvinyltransferase [Gammaproteobacteria bacterium]|nr:MAG: 3-phosphoshikimate 1-carboxyvinyltransferase [Gammaproteobacteria bacterium]
MEFYIKNGGNLQGEITVPADKSISHRSIILSSLAHGVSQITNFLQGEDSLNTLKAFEQMGVKIIRHHNDLEVHGVGMHGLKKPAGDLYMGNSGTAMRTMCGILIAQKFDSTLVGDNSLNLRPMMRIIKPLELMGGKITACKDSTAPLKITGSQNIRAIDYKMPVASAQVKTAIMLAGLYATGTTTITECSATRNHSELMLKSFGYQIETDNNKTIQLNGGGKLTCQNITIPSDISSAAFFIVGATISQGSNVLLKNILINPTRDGIIKILKLMGANIKIKNIKKNGAENIADIAVKYAPLKGIKIPHQHITSAIDEFPIIFIAASAATGTTILTEAQELKVKESDRLEAMAEGLKTLGIEVKTTDDGIKIKGGKITGGKVMSYDDHRIAMAFAIAGLVSKKPIVVKNCQNVATSFPDFVQISQSAGLQIREQ